MLFCPTFCKLAAWLPAALIPLLSVGLQADAGGDEFFERRIRPVLVEHCYECHSGTSKKIGGKLRVDSRAALLAGGDTGAALAPGDADKSLLVQVIRRGISNSQSPAQHRLPEPVVADIVAWINLGAPFPEKVLPVSESRHDAAAGGTKHWAFQPIQETSPPQGQGAARGGNAIDEFIAAKLVSHGLKRSAPASRRTLIRRASFDLTGLPPTPEEVADFLADSRPDAFGRLVERLLSSPHYGERWGRWWLDVARYADTNGQDENKVMANAWRYRDWVVRAFAKDMPFDQFTTEQLAGDLLPAAGVPEKTLFDRWTATGFLVLGPKMLAEQDKPKLVMDMVDEQIDVVSRAFLGLTVGCARCHDHKFDPVSARDYYALAGIFKSTRTMANLDFVSKFNERCISTPGHLAAIEAYEKALAAKTNEIMAAIQNANTALAARWRQQLPDYLSVAAGSESRKAAGPGADLGLDQDLVTRLGALMAPAAVTNEVSQVLHRLAASREASAHFLKEFENQEAATNTLRLAPGRVGAAFLASGGNYLEIPHTPALEPAQLTVEAWVWAAEFPAQGDTRRWVVSKNASEWAEGHYALAIDRDRAGAYLNIGGGQENVFALWSGEHALKPGQWHHLALAYDGVVFRFYLDGRETGQAAIGRARVPGTGPLVLGRRPDGFVSFKGRIDEVHVWGRALSAAELKARFERPEQPVPEAAARWEFNEISETTRALVAETEASEALFGPGGIFILPQDPRPHYPPPVREAIVALEGERDALRASAPAPAEFALAVADDKPVDLPIHLRGSHLNLAKDPVPRGFIRAAYRGDPSPLPADHSGRLELAHWLTSPENPLMARVIVNRLWQAHFGEGLVRTPDNFGVRGETPTHPELLDWLARELMRGGWSVKSMHRLIMSSATYQQAAGETAAGDPDNRLLSHFPRQRLEAEMVRDALLAVSGRLDLAQGGSLVPWKNDEYAPEDKVTADSARRSVYLPIVRDRVYDVLTIFDFANPSVGMSKRIPTVVSHQALFFLNSPLVKASARAFAKSLMAANAGDSARIGLAYQRVFGRPPTPGETDRAIRFLSAAGATVHSEASLASWTALCQTLFAANEFIYRD